MYEVYAQGQNHLLQVYLQALSFTGPFYLGLGTGGIPEGRTKTLADIVEVSGSGYARQAITRGTGGSAFTIVDNVATSPALTFANTNTNPTNEWTEATYAFLTLSASGLSAPAILLNTVELASPFSLLGGTTTPPMVFKFTQI